MKKPTNIEQAIARLQVAKRVLKMLDEFYSDNVRWKESSESDLKALTESTPEDERDLSWRISSLKEQIEDYETAIEATKVIKTLIEEAIL